MPRALFARAPARTRPTALALAAVLLLAAPARGQKFRPDDPVRVDRDDLFVAKPGVVELSTTYDVIEHTFLHRPKGPIPPAMNVNTLGEVPGSSWFTNRVGVREMSIEELVRGPGTGEGPDQSRPWTVIGGKASGITPGFTIRDGRGDVYFLKFDPMRYPNLSTAADVIGTKFFHAFGYNVPENFIVRFRREQLEIGPEARLDRAPRKRPMVAADIDEILSHVPRLADGRIRGLASRRLEGEPIGPRKFHGLRGDDPNDIFPHEHRRELRGLRVFCAWLNHDDSRSVNSLDVYVDGRYVKHYLIDFSSILGSGSDAERRIAPQNPRAGNEYILELGPVLKAAVTLGIWDRPWRKVRYPDHLEVLNIEAEFFRPELWKPEYPNPAFERMQPEDGFWAAKIVSRFSDEAVRALVATGQYASRKAEDDLAETLLRRRDKIVAHYFRQLDPLDGFRIGGAPEAPALEFLNLGERAGLGKVEGYAYQWFAFDNGSGRADPLGPEATTSVPVLPLPEGDHEYLLVRIHSRGATEPGWGEGVEVYVRNFPARTVVGIERESS